jgi:hypothetical protein
LPAVRTKEQVQKYIESRVLKVPGGCWLWFGRVSPKGYGRLSWRRPGMQKLSLAHRVVYAIFKEEPGSLCVCHKCDNRACVNPDHLFLGTHEDNMADMVKKGRQSKGIQRPSAVLTEEQVQDVRRLVAGGMMQKDVASHYGVTRQLVNYIINGKLWTHI